MAKAEVSKDLCPMALGINVLSGKWKLKIVSIIYNNGVIRFNELQKLLGDITTKTLTQQLRELEEERIISRTVYAEVPPKVEYFLSEIGKTISPVLNALCEWGNIYQQMIK